MEAYHSTKLYGEAAFHVGLWPMVNMCDEHMEAIQQLHYVEHGEELNLENLLPVTSEDVEHILRSQLPKSQEVQVQEEDHDSVLDKLMNTRMQSTLTDVSFVDLDKDPWATCPRLATIHEEAEGPSIISEGDQDALKRPGNQTSDSPPAGPSTTTLQVVEQQGEGEETEQEDSEEDRFPKFLFPLLFLLSYLHFISKLFGWSWE